MCTTGRDLGTRVLVAPAGPALAPPPAPASPHPPSFRPSAAGTAAAAKCKADPADGELVTGCNTCSKDGTSKLGRRLHASPVPNASQAGGSPHVPPSAPLPWAAIECVACAPYYGLTSAGACVKCTAPGYYGDKCVECKVSDAACRHQNKRAALPAQVAGHHLNCCDPSPSMQGDAPSVCTKCEADCGRRSCRGLYADSEGWCLPCGPGCK